MSVRKEAPAGEEPKGKEKKVEEFGAEMYLESAKALRQVGARVVLSVGAAILIWIFFLTLRILTILSQKIVEWLYT